MILLKLKPDEGDVKVQEKMRNEVVDCMEENFNEQEKVAVINSHYDDLDMELLEYTHNSDGTETPKFDPEVFQNAWNEYKKGMLPSREFFVNFPEIRVFAILYKVNIIVWQLASDFNDGLDGRTVGDMRDYHAFLHRSTDTVNLHVRRRNDIHYEFTDIPSTYEPPLTTSAGKTDLDSKFLGWLFARGDLRRNEFGDVQRSRENFQKRRGKAEDNTRTLPVAPLWCCLGFCSQRVVVIKLL